MDVSSQSWMFPRRWLQFRLSHLLLGMFLIAVVCWWSFRVPHGAQETGRDLDVAIFGRGYLICTSPITNATLYTRNGHLSVNSNGQLCVGPPGEDLLVEPQVTIPPEFMSIGIAHDGNVYYYTQGQAYAQSAGQLQLATFINTDGLREILPGFFEEAGASGQPLANTPGTNGAGLLQAGWLETPEGHRVELTTMLLVGLCGLVGWLAWEVRCLRVSLAASPALQNASSLPK